jgi:hypothetical protein
VGLEVGQRKGRKGRKGKKGRRLQDDDREEGEGSKQS